MAGRNVFSLKTEAMTVTTQAVWRAGEIYKVDLLDAAAQAYLDPSDEPAKRWRSSVAREYKAREMLFQGSSAAVYWAGGSESGGVPAHLKSSTWETFDEVYTPAALSLLIERENAAALEILISQLRSPMGVVPFVGAGLSVSFGFPSWQKFLTDASEFHSEPKSVIDLITKGDYIGAAGQLFAESADRFQLMVAQAFGSKVSEEQARQGSVSLLPTLAKGPVITTNFDHVLETAFQAAGRPFDYVITGPQPDSVIRVMHRNELALIKIHGDAFDRSARVFTGSEYEAQYPVPASHPEAVPDAVEVTKQPPMSTVSLTTVSKLARIMFTNRPLLFLGCSLDRDRTLDVLKTLHNEVPGLTHYAVLGASYKSQAIRKRRRELGDYGIVPLWFAPGDYSGIDRLLSRLIQDASTRVVWKSTSKKRAVISRDEDPPLTPKEVQDDSQIQDIQNIDAIIRRLARKIVQGQLAFFLGSGAHLTSTLGARHFYASLAKDYEFNEIDSQRAEVAQYIVDREGKAEAWAAAKSQLQASSIPLSIVYRFLAALPKLLRASKQEAVAHQYLLTTNYDIVLEKALAKAGEPFHLLYYQADGKDEGRFLHRDLDGSIRAIEVPLNIRSFEEEAHIVTKLDGGIPWDEHLVETVSISPVDFSISAGRLPIALPRNVADVLRNRSLLILGSSLRDPHVQRLIRWSTESRCVLKTWAVQYEVSANTRKYWEAARVELIQCNLAYFIPALWKHVIDVLKGPSETA